MKRIPLLPERARPLLFAHRGCSSLAPENTMPAFNKARECGAPGIELDIHRCTSGELVVCHDDTFTRTAGCDRRVESMSLAEIRELDVGSWFDSAFTGTTVPLLQDVLDEFTPDLYIDIELKTKKTKDDPLPAALAEMLKKLDKRTRASLTVSSFNPVALKHFKELEPAVPTALIWSADREVPWYLRSGQGRWIAGCDYLKPVHSKAGSFSVFLLGRLGGRPLVPWTVDDTALARTLTRGGCEGIISNRPQDLLPQLKNGVR